MFNINVLDPVVMLWRSTTGPDDRPSDEGYDALDRYINKNSTSNGAADTSSHVPFWVFTIIFKGLSALFTRHSVGEYNHQSLKGTTTGEDIFDKVCQTMEELDLDS